MTPGQATRVAVALDAVRGRAGAAVEIGLILGSGLGGLANEVAGPTIPYGAIPGFPASTAPGHAGRLVVGELAGRRVAAMQGRAHLYEGLSAQDVAMGVYLLQGLGARALIVTNAAGALNPDFRLGEVMLIEDHLNFTGTNPLTGPDQPGLGPRFPDLSRAWDPELRAAAGRAAETAGVALRRGIYVGVAGPSLETSAERRFFRVAGGDAVGMSTVIEAIAAAHAGLPLIGLSAITNSATGGAAQEPDTLEAVLAMAAVAGEKIAAILGRLLPEL